MIIYSLESDKIIQLINNEVEYEKGKIIHQLVEEDERSEEKRKMYEGRDYYNVENTAISNKKFNEMKIGDSSITLDGMPNNKRRHPDFRIAVDQKVGYIEHPTFQSDNEKEMETISKVLDNEDFEDIINDWESGASQYGIEYLHPYIEDDESLAFTIIPATQIIPIYDTRFQKKLVSALRYYPYELFNDGIAKKLHQVEIYTSDKIEFWEEYEAGKYKKNDEQPNLFLNRKSGENVERINLSWGVVPLIPLYNNSKKQSDLVLGKDLLDDYDLHKSVMSNELENIMESILHIQGYQINGESEDEIKREWEKLKRNIKLLGMIVTDDENASVTQIKNELPTQAKDSHLDRTKKEIYTAFMAVDPSLVGDGNITNIVLKARYLLLDIKSNLLIAKLKKAIRQLLLFIEKYVDIVGGYDPIDAKNIKINIDKNKILNEKEVVEVLNMSTETISRETRVALHPYVKDAQEELKKLKKEDAQMETQYDKNLDDLAE